jgi:uncharacterized iron-regulated protein
MDLRIAAISLLFLAACASTRTASDLTRTTTPALLLGEQHDAPEHHRLQREVVQALAGRGGLAAVAIEMAERGAGTTGLPPQASEADVQRALRWDAQAWPWEDYGPAVMAAVAAGVPVVGANLPRDAMRAAMNDAAFDRLLPGAALEAQQQAIRTGHCGLLPDSQIAPMARIQVARDQAMAQTIAQLLQPGKTVVLIAGAGHVDPQLGVPMHLAAIEHQAVVLPAQAGSRDYCEEMRKSMGLSSRP